MQVTHFKFCLFSVVTFISIPVVGFGASDSSSHFATDKIDGLVLAQVDLPGPPLAGSRDRPSEDQALFKSVAPQTNGGEQCKDAIRQAMKSKAGTVGNSKALKLGLDGPKLTTYCSAPAKIVTGEEHRVFGVSACLEHDICYRLPGVSQAECDNNFYKNMVENCGQFYGVPTQQELQAGKAKPYEKCRRWARTWQNSVRAGGLVARYRAQREQYPQCVSQAMVRGDGSIDQYIHVDGKDKAIRMYSEGNSADKSKVRVCLRNVVSGRNKGLHFEPGAKKPRYKVKKKGGRVCGEHPAGPHTVTWTFWKRKGVKMVEVGKVKFNASGFAGQKITFDWLKH